MHQKTHTRCIHREVYTFTIHINHTQCYTHMYWKCAMAAMFYLTDLIFLATLVEGHPRDISVKLFGNLVNSLWQDDFLCVLYIGKPSHGPCLPVMIFDESDIFSDFGKGSCKEHFCEIIWKSDKPFRGCSSKYLLMYRQTDRHRMIWKTHLIITSCATLFETSLFEG